ncbi:hypothetical protein KTAU_28200 [Thermogemmatispora aurantia]|jgi:transcriptional regulator with XRE-family HTH domain|uniref:helix-turn-helix domain-containing protein n=1 Tax=Thermogemmatispora aurantia TaxID=2045279 RepID=UPI00124E4ED5|nr:helix-turn-helix transcriptional regulator [Thermogemmatispora aurantia]GER84184.1 hypothetical protein KTAU_28200 [Thermogemmatispora aurantia]
MGPLDDDPGKQLQRKVNLLLRTARMQRGWSQQQLADFAGISVATVERAERGEPIRIDSVQRLCQCLGRTPEELGLVPPLVGTGQISAGPSAALLRGSSISAAVPPFTTGFVQTEKDANDEEEAMKRRDASLLLASLAGGMIAVPSSSIASIASLWSDELLALYRRAVEACQGLYNEGKFIYLEAILPLYIQQLSALAERTSPLQRESARLAASACELGCALATERTDFGTAIQYGKRALDFARQAQDASLSVVACIRLANVGWHQGQGTVAIRAYRRALTFVDEEKSSISPALKGRIYAGLAEASALCGDRAGASQALDLAYQHYVAENGPRRYALYIFGDVQTRLLLGQIHEARSALEQAAREIPPETLTGIYRVDFLYYQAALAHAQGDLEAECTFLVNGIYQARSIESRLYFHKFANSYQALKLQWKHEKRVTSLEEHFQLW